ncbi:MAG: glycosyltransferase family protein [Bacteroidota bacterium]
MKIMAITQARMGSSRLPGKVLKTVNGKTLLEIHIERILKSRRIDQLLVATTIDPADDAIATLVANINLPVYRGSVKNVLDRFYQAALPYQPDWVVRLTSDCPLMDAALIDEMIDTAIEKNTDYCSNGLQPTFPDGLDIEVFKLTALEKAWREAISDSDKEHVTPYIYNHSTFKQQNLFTAFNFTFESNYENVRLTVDESFDFEVIKILIEKLGVHKDWKTYADYYRSNELIKTINQHINRNEGYHNSLKNNS